MTQTPPQAASRLARSLTALSLLTLSACIDPISAEVETPDMYVNPFAVGGGQVTGGAQVTGGVTPPEGATSSGGDDPWCTPGERLDLCSICGPAGRALMPTHDPMCDPVNCDELTRFILEIDPDGAKRCVRYSHSLVGGSCFRLGYCHSTTETACIEKPPIDAFKIYPGCGTYQDCDIGAVATPAPMGSRCHGYGECLAEGGPCNIPAHCGQLAVSQNPNAQHTFCGNTETTCEVNVVARGTASDQDTVNCDIYCAQSVMRCSNAWDVNTPCMKGNQIGCNQERATLICECRAQ